MAARQSPNIDGRSATADSGGAPSKRQERLSPRVGSRGRGRDAVEFFTIAEVAECLNVSTRTVRRWIERGQLIAHRFGAVVRIAESDLRAFLARYRDF